VREDLEISTSLIPQKDKDDEAGRVLLTRIIAVSAVCATIRSTAYVSSSFHHWNEEPHA